MRAALNKAAAFGNRVMDVVAEVAPWLVIALFVYSLGYAGLWAMGAV